VPEHSFSHLVLWKLRRIGEVEKGLKVALGCWPSSEVLEGQWALQEEAPHCPHKNKRKKQSNLRGISLQENKTKKHSIQLYSFPPLKIRFSLSGYVPSIHEPQLLPRASPPPEIW
jgi:hypothetical protein